MSSRVVERPSIAADRAHHAGRVGQKFRSQIRHQGVRVWKVAAEERIDAGRIGQCRETVGAGQRQKQGHREAAIEIRQRDQHEAAARPDVQCVLVNLMFRF